MPPKPKSFKKPKTKPKSKTQDPQSENDFLEAADEFEAAAGKWRAGDVAKATRFFNRAIDAYNEGLKRFPQSFDLAYNKANLEYNIIQDDRIAVQLGNRTALLEEALVSHRFAASLNASNTDIQFNTAQVLTSLAEALHESGIQEAEKLPARALLEEAVDIFTKCAVTQQEQYTQIQAEIAKTQNEVEQMGYQGQLQSEIEKEDHSQHDTDVEPPGEWAVVEEALTPETILETYAAQLGALTTLLGLYSEAVDLSALYEKSRIGQNTTEVQIPSLLHLISSSASQNPPAAPEQPSKAGPTLSIGTSSSSKNEQEETTPRDDALLAAANFRASLAELNYRSGNSTSLDYAKTIEQIFTPLTTPSSLSPSSDSQSTTSTAALTHAQSAYTDALTTLASAIADGRTYNSSSSSTAFLTDLETQWTALTQAQNILTQVFSSSSSSSSSSTTTTGSQASSPTTASPQRLADVFLARGDIDLFRFRISLFEVAKPRWVNSRATLVKNAGVFYRGARSYAGKAGVGEVQGVADAKAVVAEVMEQVASGSAGVAKEHWKGRSGDVGRVLEEMVEEGIVGRENAEGVIKYVR